MEMIKLLEYLCLLRAFTKCYIQIKRSQVGLYKSCLVVKYDRVQLSTAHSSRLLAKLPVNRRNAA